MQRTALSVFAGLVAALIIGGALYLLLSNDDDPLTIEATASPSPTPSPLTLPSASPSASPTTSPTASPAASATPTATPIAAPAPSAEPAAGVDCNRTPSFCSSTTGTMEIKDDKLVTSGTTQHQIDYSSVPNTTMTWKIIREGGGDANNGEDVSKLEVVVVIHNDTDRTWVVPRREIALFVTLDGKELHNIVTSGADFEMRPRGSLTARYDVPIHDTGKYTWRGKTSFYAR